MTPFGEKLRHLRTQHGVTQKRMAADLDISAAYLSALEHGRRGRPSPGLVLQICGYFNIIWDEAEELKRLAGLSAPKVTLDTGGLSPLATEVANRLGRDLDKLDDEALAEMLAVLNRKTVG